MNRAALIVGVALAVASGCRASLPHPRQPLVSTPHEEFRAAAPHALAPVHVGFPEIEQWSLSNGFPVYLLNRPGDATAVARFVCRRCGESDIDVPAGMPALSMSLLARGTRNRMRASIRDRSLLVDGTVTHDSGSLEIIGDASQIDAAIENIGNTVTQPAISEELFETVRGQMVQHVFEDADGVMSELAREGIFGSRHPYTRPLSGRGPSLQRIQLAQLVAYIREHYISSDSALVVVGPFTRAQISVIAERAFGSWATGPAPARSTTQVGPVNPTAIFLDRPRAGSSLIMVGIPSAARTAEDYPAMALLDSVLGGLFSSRANLALREQGGYAYSAHSLAESHRDSGMLLLMTEVATDQTVPALRELLAAIERVHREEVSEQELIAARETWRLRAMGRLEQPERAAAAIGELFTFDLATDAYASLAERVRETPGSVLLRAGADRLARSQLRIVVSGDHERVGSAFDTAFGPVEMHYLRR